MDVDTYLRDPRSRRNFFRMAGVSLAGGSAVLLAACGRGEEAASGSQQADDEPAGGGRAGADVEILNSALDLELMAVAAYTAGAKLLKGEALEVGKTFLSQEQEHADGLAQAIKDLGGTPNRAKAEYDFPKLSGQEDVLRFAVDLENTAIAAYIDALPKLSDPKLRGTAAAIITNEAEHVSVLLSALGMPPVPEAFVVGKA